MAAHASRNIYLEQIIQAVDRGEDIYLVTADLAAPCLDDFREKYPERYVPVGIAEQNLITVASGIAMSKKKVVAYTSNPFLVFRAFDQIRNCIGLMNLPMTIVGVGAGFSIPEYGATHFSLEDINLLRTCANIQSINISDLTLAQYMAQKTLDAERPYYLRFDKLVQNSYDLTEKEFKQGFRYLQDTGIEDVCILSTGIMSSECMKILEDLSIKISVIDVFAFPFDAVALAAAVQSYHRLITVEEMILQGGLGSSVLEMLSDAEVMIPVRRFGVDMSEGYPAQYGSREWHMQRYGLDMESLKKAFSKEVMRIRASK